MDATVQPMEKLNSTFYMPDGVFGIDVYIGGVVGAYNMSASGYTSAVAGDVGKLVTGGTSGATGILQDYDNSTRYWVIGKLNNIAFTDGEAITITNGTGAATLSTQTTDTYDYTFGDVYLARGFYDNEQVVGHSTKFKTSHPVILGGGIEDDGDLAIGGEINSAKGIIVTGGSSEDGKMFYSASSGLSLRGVAGSSYDFFLNGAGGSLLMRNPTGTTDLQINDILMQQRFQLKDGGTLGAVNDLTLGEGNYFTLSTGADLQRILSTDWQDGSVVFLDVPASLRITHQGASSGSDRDWETITFSKC